MSRAAFCTALLVLSSCGGRFASPFVSSKTLFLRLLIYSLLFIKKKSASHSNLLRLDIKFVSYVCKVLEETLKKL